MNSPAPLKVLVADDEPLARERLRELLAKLPTVVLLGFAEDGPTTVDAIRNQKPDLVLLDMQMPGLSGPEVIEQIGCDQMPMTIFVTAHQKYAIDAFDFGAIDYLVKPFERRRFETAINRAVEFRTHKQGSAGNEPHAERTDETAGLTPTERSTKGYYRRLAVESRHIMRVIHVENIDFITANGVYSQLHIGEKTFLLRESMHALEARLDPDHFLRIHRSTIVQLDRIDSLMREAGNDCTLKLKNGVQLMVSRARVRTLEAWMTGS